MADLLRLAQVQGQLSGKDGVPSGSLGADTVVGSSLEARNTHRRASVPSDKAGMQLFEGPRIRLYHVATLPK
jgi:hypothetical protein